MSRVKLDGVATRVKKIQIRNFKGMKDAVFEPGRFACLVGENNAGKSTVLQALVYALSRVSSLPEALFYDTKKPIEFALELTGVTIQHLARLAPEPGVEGLFEG